MTITSKSGKLITLRPPRRSDLDVLFDYITTIGKEDTYIFVNPDEPVTYKEEKDYLEGVLKKLRAKNQIYFLTFYQYQLIGLASVIKLDRRQQHIGRFGITLLKEYRHDGIGEQLTKIIIEQAQKQLGIKQIILGCFANNTIAYKLYRKLGFQKYGRLPRGILYKSQYIDEILMCKFLE